MKNITEDRDEMPDDVGRRWVYRARRGYGIRPDEATCWFAEVQQDQDRHVVSLGRSPGDVLAEAIAYAGAARQSGYGRWTLEVYGDGENSPQELVVYPMMDEVM